ncbi:peptidase S9, prolyl oligopeptidase [Haematococcus lacustris]
MVERGLAWAVVHVRGGGCLGPVWHEAGRGSAKPLGVEDLLAAAQLLLRGGWTGAGGLALVAESAGGWLAGALINNHPQLLRAVVLTVPSLDVLTSMAVDADGDAAELGDVRHDRSAYESVMRWDPYPNVGVKEPMPPMMVRTALFDERVGYWEAAKYVAKLRVAARSAAAGEQHSPLLLQVKPGEHLSYNTIPDNAKLAAFLDAAF